MKTWNNGKIINGEVKIDSFNYSLHYAAPTVWEGMRSYIQMDGTSKIFKLEEHIERLLKGAQFFDMQIKHSKSDLINGCKDLVKANGGGSLYIRPIAYNSSSCEGVSQSDSTISVDIYAVKLEIGLPKTGATLVTSAYRRGYPNNLMQVKTPMNYGLLPLFQKEAKAAGSDDVLVLDNQGYVAEASVANFFILKNGTFFTPPNDGNILPGITRATISNEIITNPSVFFKKYKMSPRVVEKKITLPDIYQADEMFLCGTYAEVTPVTNVNGYAIGNGQVGKLTSIIIKEYQELVVNNKR